MTRAFTAERRRIAGLRLAAQRISGPRFATPLDTVSHLVAMQAQDFPGAKWSVGLRTAGATDAAIETALESRQIVRSWPMRGTLHFTAATDLGWILDLTAERSLASVAGRHRQLGLTGDDLAHARRIAEMLLADGPRPRTELLAALEAAGQSTANQRGAHFIVALALTKAIVFGPVDGKQQTFALFDEWMPPTRVLARDEALAEFALRYVAGHGPATVRDFAWWSSLTLTEARRGLAAVESQLEHEGDYYFDPSLEPAADGVWALPGFDEYLLGYQDRSATLHPDHFQSIVPGGNGMFLPTIVIGGEVVGTWKRTVTAKEAVVEALPFGPLSVAQRKGFAAASARYGDFMGRTTRMVE